MNIEEFRACCLALPYVEERFPFDETTLVFCVGGHMFAMVGLDSPDRVNLKCEPGVAEELREKYEGVQPGWHMNKKHWNTVFLSSDVPSPLIRRMVADSFKLVYSKLTRKERAQMPL